MKFMSGPVYDFSSLLLNIELEFDNLSRPPLFMQNGMIGQNNTGLIFHNVATAQYRVRSLRVCFQNLSPAFKLMVGAKPISILLIPRSINLVSAEGSSLRAMIVLFATLRKLRT